MTLIPIPIVPTAVAPQSAAAKSASNQASSAMGNLSGIAGLPIRQSHAATEGNNFQALMAALLVVNPPQPQVAEPTADSVTGQSKKSAVAALASQAGTCVNAAMVNAAMLGTTIANLPHAADAAPNGSNLAGPVSNKTATISQLLSPNQANVSAASVPDSSDQASLLTPLSQGPTLNEGLPAGTIQSAPQTVEPGPKETSSESRPALPLLSAAAPPLLDAVVPHSPTKSVSPSSPSAKAVQLALPKDEFGNGAGIVVNAIEPSPDQPSVRLSSLDVTKAPLQSLLPGSSRESSQKTGSVGGEADDRRKNLGDDKIGEAVPLAEPALSQASPNTTVKASETSAPATSVQHQIATEVVGRAQWVTQNGRTEFQIRLNPPDLGTVKVHMTLSDQAVQARLVVHQVGTQQLIESQMESLRQSLAQAGIALSGLQVSTNGQGNTGGRQEPHSPKSTQVQHSAVSQIDSSAGVRMINSRNSALVDVIA